ncbi:MAG: hypothetical protein LBH26_08065 [Treponema sp.]|jgi:hypothetical protein|nr:hypothetical protein [Treponema sp.]
MMKNRIGRARFFQLFLLCLAFAVLPAGCASLTEKIGGLLDGSGRGEKVLFRYRSEGRGIEYREAERSGRREAVILLDGLPTVKLLASPPDPRGFFSLESLEFLAGSLSGWHQFSLALSGQGEFRPRGEDASFRLTGPLEAIDITKGKIRLEENRLGGEEALASLRKRYERIKALGGWMKSRDGVPPAAPASREYFERYWKPLLLPEIVRGKLRPQSFRDQDGPWVRAEQVSWNAGYTALLFPPDLAEYRNSGALLRDWEETVEWIYLEYAWDRVFRVLQEESVNLKLYSGSPNP